MTFNPEPSKQAVELLFSNKGKKITHFPLFFNNQEVPKVNEHKHLSLTHDTQLLFTKHITEKISNARRSIGVIRYLRHMFP